MVIGSVEPHYSASKIFQCLVTAPRLFAFFHEESEGRSVLEQCQADPFYVPFRADTEETTMLGELARKIADFANPEQPWEANLDPLEEYTTNRNARHFLSAVEQVIAPHVMTHRLAILSTHPIQYNAPLFRMLHDEEELVVQVFFSKTWDQVKYDPDFGQEVVWDIPVSEGYPHSTHNASSKAGKEELCTAIRAFKADALLVYGWNFPGHFAVMRKLHGTLPIWFRGDSHLLNPMPIWKKAMRKAMLTWVYRHVDVAFTVGTANEAYYRWGGLKQSQLIRAPHAVDVDYWASEEAGRSKEAIQWRKELSIPTAARVVGFAGKVEPIKQVDLIIQSTLDSGEHHHVIIAGTGPLEAKFKEQFGQEPRVHFLGFVNQSRMPIFYRMIDLLALASSSETWGLCVNEAMACGTPCIVSDRTGCSLDMFHHAETGAVAPWNDGGAWRQGIATCLTRTAPDLTSSSIHDQFHPQRFVEAIRTEIDRS